MQQLFHEIKINTKGQGLYDFTSETVSWLDEQEIKVDLGSDQTSLHNPWSGGYYPVGLTFEESNRMMSEEPEKFKEQVRFSLRRQVMAINNHTAKGTYFFDYGNAFLLEASR